MSTSRPIGPVHTGRGVPRELRYAVIVATHGTRPDGLLDLLKSLTRNGRLGIYVVDSSGSYSCGPRALDTIVGGEGRLPGPDNSTRGVVALRVPNFGAPHSLNVGVRRCLSDGVELVTLLDDDVSLAGPLPTDRIVEFFFSRCDPGGDLLILPENSARQSHAPGHAVTSGMTFSPLLFSRCTFREELVMDLFDSQFCEDVARQGGKLVNFPEALINIEPIGKPGRLGISALPNWRLYLLVRNSVTLARERAGAQTGKVRFGLFLVASWTAKSLLAGGDLRGVLSALINGVADAIRGQLGVTRALQRLSNHRFDLPPAGGASSNRGTIL